MAASGMAKSVRSVAMRNLAGRAIPTPPPITTPSMTAITGLG